MTAKKRIIFITDGDQSAVDAVKVAASNLGCHFLWKSAGSPSKKDHLFLLQEIEMANNDPIIVLFDDGGSPGIGPGESLMLEITRAETIELLGVIAVAADSNVNDWTNVHVCIDRLGRLTEYGVDKQGRKETEIGRIRGDTVNCLNIESIPLIIGIGDVGKMGGFDSIKKNAPVTTKAIQVILERSGLHEPPTVNNYRDWE